MPRRIKNEGGLYNLTEIPMDQVMEYQAHEVGEPFFLMLKVPAEDEKFMDDYKHYTKSNINVCYAAPRSAGKPRNWYETQLTVTKEARLQKGYPYKGVPFYAVTDDGFGFLAHTTSQNNKQFAAVGDELILGKWIKGRLVEDGLVTPIEDTSKDLNRLGMITKEMLEEYGCNAVAFQQTDLRIEDPINNNNTYEVWTLKLVQIDDE